MVGDVNLFFADSIDHTTAEVDIMIAGQLMSVAVLCWSVTCSSTRDPLCQGQDRLVLVS